LTYSHTKADLTQVIAAAAEVFANLRPLWGTSRLAAAVATRKQG
jgi:hypothetical protein